MAARPGLGRNDGAGADPELSFEAKTLSGRSVSFPDDFSGKLVLVDFWATWCTPCRKVIPHVQELNRQFGGKGMVVLGVTLDEGRVPATTVERFVKERDMPWEQVYQGASEIADQFGVEGIPAAFLMDGDTGEVLASGDKLLGDKAQAVVQRFLDARSPKSGRQKP